MDGTIETSYSTKPQGHHPLGVGSSDYLHPELERLLLDSYHNRYLTMLDVSIPLFNKQGLRLLMDERTAECIVAFLQRTPRFCKLQLDVAWQTKGALNVFGGFLRITQQISTLAFRQQPQSHDGSKHPIQSFSWVDTLAGDLKSNESIQEYSWTNFDFEKDVGARSLFACWDLRVKTLKLHDCRFGSNANFLVKGLRPQLQDVTLFQCHFPEDSAGAQIVSALAESCPQLKRLNICWNRGHESKTLLSLVQLLRSPSVRLSSLSLTQNKGLFQDPTSEEAFHHTLAYGNDSILNIQISTGNEDNKGGSAQALQLLQCRLRNRVNARVRHTINTTTMDSNLSLWGPALGNLARPDPTTGSCFVSVSGLFLAVSSLSQKLAEQAVSETRTVL